MKQINYANLESSRITPANYLMFVEYLMHGGQLDSTSLLDIRDCIDKEAQEERNKLYDAAGRNELTWKEVDPDKGEKGKKVTQRQLALINFINRQPNSFGLAGDLASPLAYHFTDPAALESILYDNHLAGDYGEYLGACLTTNKYLDHPELTTVRYYGELNASTFASLGTRIDLNLQKITAAGLKLRLGSESMGTHIGENEIRVGGANGIPNVRSYIEQIQVDLNIVSECDYQSLIKISQANNIPIIEKKEYARPKRIIKTIPAHKDKKQITADLSVLPVPVSNSLKR